MKNLCVRRLGRKRPPPDIFGKMSKKNGNGFNPLNLTQNYGINQN